LLKQLSFSNDQYQVKKLVKFMLSTVRSVVSFYYFWIPVFGSINFYEFAASLNLIRGGAREEAAHVV